MGFQLVTGRLLVNTNTHVCMTLYCYSKNTGGIHVYPDGRNKIQVL